MKKKVIVISLVTMFTVALYFWYNSDNFKHSYKNINFLKDNNENKKLNNNISNENIILKVKSSADLAYNLADPNVLENMSDCIIIGKVKEIEGSTNYNPVKKEYVMTLTLGKIKVNKVIKGSSLEKNQEANFIRLGGVINVESYEKGLTERQKERQKINTLTAEQKKQYYVSEYFENDIKIEKDKYYLMYLKYNNDFQRYSVIGFEYGLREYNIDTKKFKNNTTNNWEDSKYNINDIEL